MTGLLHQFFIPTPLIHKGFLPTPTKKDRETIPVTLKRSGHCPEYFFWEYMLFFLIIGSRTRSFLQRGHGTERLLSLAAIISLWEPEYLLPGKWVTGPTLSNSPLSAKGSFWSSWQWCQRVLKTILPVYPVCMGIAVVKLQDSGEKRQELNAYRCPSCDSFLFKGDVSSLAMTCPRCNKFVKIQKGNS